MQAMLALPEDAQRRFVSQHPAGYSFFGVYQILYRQMNWLLHGGVNSLDGVIKRGDAPAESIVHLDEPIATPSNAVSSGRMVYALLLLVSSHSLGFPGSGAIHAIFERADI